MAAAQKAVSSPLLEDGSVNGARGVIINVTGGPDLGLMEINEASSVIQEAAHEDANIIFGAVVDPSLVGKVKITVIATGFDRPGRTVAPSLETPVDLQSYTDHIVSRAAEAAPQMSSPDADLAALPLTGRGATPPLVVNRRAGIGLTPTRPVPHTAGPVVSGDEGGEGSPLDVPAFLRRQH
jgi:cell division protein FtsZ